MTRANVQAERMFGHAAGALEGMALASRVRAMSLVHERLYQSGTLGTICLDEYVGELCEQLASAGAPQRRGIVLALEVAPVDVGLDLAVPLGLLLNELVSNSLKHAFPEGRRGAIRVTLAPEVGEGGHADNKLLRLTVHDDGIGLPPDVDRTTLPTLGLRLVSALSEQLHAKLVFENRDGACVTLIFHAGGNGAHGPGHAADACPGTR